MEPAVEAIHESIHAEYKQKLADAEWDAAVQRAHVKARDVIIADLRAVLDTATTP